MKRKENKKVKIIRKDQIKPFGKLEKEKPLLEPSRSFTNRSEGSRSFTERVGSFHEKINSVAGLFHPYVVKKEKAMSADPVS